MSFQPALPAAANELPHVAMAGPHPFAVQGYCLLSSGRTPNPIISLICIGPWIVRGIAASVVGPQARSCIIIWGRLHGRRSISRGRRQRRSRTYDWLNVSLEQTPPGLSTPLLAGRWSDGNRANRQGDCNHRCRKWRWPSMSAEGHNDLPSIVIDVLEVVADEPCNNTRKCDRPIRFGRSDMRDGPPRSTPALQTVAVSLGCGMWGRSRQTSVARATHDQDSHQEAANRHRGQRPGTEQCPLLPTRVTHVRSLPLGNHRRVGGHRTSSGAPCWTCSASAPDRVAGGDAPRFVGAVFPLF
jgi:hypothetical protein